MYYIYKIENKVNHKIYIGLTNNIDRRHNRHFSDLRHNRHDNKFMQSEFNKYGEDAFSFEIVFQGDVTSDEISKLEEKYVAQYDSYHNGYNQNQGGNFGPANGGSKLTKTDIFNILSALEFMPRPGQVLSDMYNVTKTTISRIKLGTNHCEYYDEYHSLSLEERRAIYDNFCKTTNFYQDKAKSTVYKSKRKLSEDQVHMIFLNESYSPRLIPIKHLMTKIGVKSSNAIYDILKGGSYRDYALTFKDITNEKKQELLVSLLGDK